MVGVEFVPCLKCWRDVLVVDDRLEAHPCENAGASAHASRVAVAELEVRTCEGALASAELAVLEAKRRVLEAGESLDAARAALEALRANGGAP